jgi:Predicted RNA-binding protein containing KH domain, possibly ribosomal protein
MELNNIQKKKVRSIAQTIKASVQIGKNEIGDTLLETIIAGLAANEIIKVKLLQNAILTKTEVSEILEKNIKPDYLYTIGNQFVLYKVSQKKEKQKYSKEINKLSS